MNNQLMKRHLYFHPQLECVVSLFRCLTVCFSVVCVVVAAALDVRFQAEMSVLHALISRNGFTFGERF